MKKLFSLALTAAMVLTLAVPALAATPGMGNFRKSETYTGFSDVPAGHWAAGVVQTCCEYALMNGNPDGTFNLTGSLTVAEALTMAARVHAIYTTGETFTAAGEPWYQPYVDDCVAAGIITADEFSDYTTRATRAQMAGIFARALPAGELTVINTGAAPDVTDATPYAAQIRSLYAAGVLTGSDIYGTFLPGDTITRAEAAAIIARIAIPAERKSVTLMRDVQLTPAGTAAIPEDFADISAQAGMTGWGSDAGLFVYQSDTDANAYRGLTITLMPAETVHELLLETFGTAVSGLKTGTVKFGNLPAYRISFTYTGSGSSLPAVAYLYIDGDTLTMAVMAALDSGILTAMANNYRLNGSAASPQL